MRTPTKNPGVVRFTGVIQQAAEDANGSIWVDFPYDLIELYGIGNLVPVIMTFDGLTYQGSIAKMCGPHPMLLIKREIEAQLGKKKGDTVEVTVTLDDKPREVVVPPELAEALSNNTSAKALFDGLAYTYRKEYARWVGEAKQAETRQRRVAKSIEMILDKQKLS